MNIEIALTMPEYHWTTPMWVLTVGGVEHYSAIEGHNDPRVEEYKRGHWSLNQDDIIDVLRGDLFIYERGGKLWFSTKAKVKAETIARELNK